jgi:periplasmic protein TonB
MAPRQNYTPATAASVALHGLLVAAVLFMRPWSRDLPVGSVVAVNIVSNAQVTDMRAAAQADQIQSAQSETPVAEAPAEPELPSPTAETKLPTPMPMPMPTPTPKSAPAARPSKPLDLDALAASIAKTTRSKPAPGAKGAPQQETALQPRAAAGAGQGLSASAMAGLANELQRRWNPNCDVEGGRDVKIRVNFVLGSGGQILGLVDAGGLENAANPVVKAAAERAIRAVHQAAPFSTLPRDFFGQRIAVNFNAREACG